MKLITLALVAFFLAVVAAKLSETEYAIHFGKFSQDYNKKYATSDEAAYRYRVFKSNLDYINTHNAKNLGYTLAVNQFADFTNAEFKERVLGLKLDLSTKKRAPGGLHVPSNLAVPATVDWRKSGIVTPVKNQGQCGSCWSFSTTGSVEGAVANATKKLISLSEQELVDCSGSYGNNGCEGGLMDYAFQYIMANGIESEANYPYTAEDGDCESSQHGPAVAKISSYKDIPSGSESSLLDAVAQRPVSVAIDASQSSFQFYSSGVYYEPSCSSSELDHGVLAVGYGTYNGKTYWLVKNSWGTSWGQSGYIFMARNKSNNCGIATSASYPIV